MSSNPPQFDGNLRRNARGYLEADFGSVRFQFSESGKPSWSFPDGLSWRLRWFDRNFGPLLDGVPTTSELSRTVIIIVSGNRIPLSLTCEGGPDCGFLSGVQGWNLSGPHRNDELNLIEYRYTKGPPAAAIYVSADPAYVEHINGIRPFALCEQFRITGQMDGLRQCQGVGLLSSDVSYRYDFSEALLPEWQILDSRVREFLVSTTRPAEDAHADQ